MDPLAPSLTITDKDGKGRINYIGNLRPDFLFKPTPGMWFTNQPDEVLNQLVELYDQEPYPTQDAMKETAARFKATLPQIESFYKNMHIKYQSGFL
mmetsp:Transcript_15165/g.51893  ORF Transcript_15165/g.51893 Transcript_15165/m.51893 type:complete len:96 (+) Transcript_15165:62-349(+)